MVLRVNMSRGGGNLGSAAASGLQGIIRLWAPQFSDKKYF